MDSCVLILFVLYRVLISILLFFVIILDMHIILYAVTSVLCSESLWNCLLNKVPSVSSLTSFKTELNAKDTPV